MDTFPFALSAQVCCFNVTCVQLHDCLELQGHSVCFPTSTLHSGHPPLCELEDMIFYPLGSLLLVFSVPRTLTSSPSPAHTYSVLAAYLRLILPISP